MRSGDRRVEVFGKSPEVGGLFFSRFGIEVQRTKMARVKYFFAKGEVVTLEIG